MPTTAKKLTLKEAYEIVGRQRSEEHRKRAEKREKVDQFIKENTCPHCGECPPIPPSLEY